jgi:DNA-binding transcriptional ArsR family regulator
MAFGIEANFGRIMWYIFAGMRGGTTRIKLVEFLMERPSNMNQISKELGMDYKTIQHHVKILKENKIIVAEEKKYGTTYFPSALLETNKESFFEIREKLKKLEEKRLRKKKIREEWRQSK